MTNPTHLFISYAVEDVALARWLAQKLAARGHAVWFDKIKSLGGEPWPHAVDDVIKHHTFRMLALISENSVRKKKPTAEWTLAQRISKQHGTHFLIPLQLDNSDPDLSIDTEGSISFTDGWAKGLKELLRVLDSAKAPRTLANGAHLAAASFRQDEDLMNESGELLFANIIRVTSLPEALLVYQAADTISAAEREKLESAWTFQQVAKDTVVALMPPPPEFEERIRPARETLDWSQPGLFHNLRVRDIAGSLILKALTRRLLDIGCLKHPNPARSDTFFLPEMLAEGGHLDLLGFGGKKIRIPIHGKVTFRRGGGVTETNFHYFAFRLRLARGLDSGFYIQLTPTLAFFDEKGEPLADDKSVQTRLRRVTRTWDNEEWLSRLMAAEHVLYRSPSSGPNDPSLESGLTTLNSPRGLNEAVVESGGAAVKITKEEFELDEPETEEANE